jgi:hypothetical protein
MSWLGWVFHQSAGWLGWWSAIKFFLIQKNYMVFSVEVHTMYVYIRILHRVLQFRSSQKKVVAACFVDLLNWNAEPVIVNLWRSSGIDSQPGGSVLQPYLSSLPAGHIGCLKRFLGSIKHLQIRTLYTVQYVKKTIIKAKNLFLHVLVQRVYSWT